MANRLVLAAFLILSLFLSGCEDTDIGMALQAVVDAVRVATLDDEDVERLALEVSRQADKKHTVAPPGNHHAKRLQSLSDGYHSAKGRQFNFKVYLSPDANAFAMADGSIRIYSGLMDMMNDDELLFVMGHEMGHVVEKHIKKKIRIAYANSAVRKAIASQQNAAGDIARSVLGALAESLLNAQFSQHEEREADDFGVKLLKEKGHGVQPAVSALMKLAASSGGDHSFLSSHPAPEARAKRLEENALAPEAIEKPSFFNRFVNWLKGFWPFEEQTSLRTFISSSISGGCFG